MTLDEAFACLRRDVHDRARANDVTAALDTLRAALAALVAQEVFVEHRREAVASAVFDKIEDRALVGDLPEIAAPAGYLRTAVRRRSMDVARAEATAERAKRVLEQKADAARAAAAAHAERNADWPHLERLVAIVLRGMDPAYRRSNEQAWATLALIHREGLSLRESVMRVMEDDVASVADLEAQVQRMHKAHQRLRKAILAEIDARIATGREVDMAHGCRTLLATLRRRCPNRAPSRVSPAKER